MESQPPMQRDYASWAVSLYKVGLRPIPCWGGGKALPGTCFKTLADHPPDVDSVARADYRGGLAIVCGTEAPLGGYIVGLDIDEGPASWPAWPLGTVYAEAGSRTGKWHIFLTTVDRLSGQINLTDDAGHLVAEVKGRGASLRVYPTHAPGKPRAPRPAFLAQGPLPAQLSVQTLVSALESYLSVTLGRTVKHVTTARPAGHHSDCIRAPSSFLARAVADELERRGCRLRPRNGQGWQLGHCPFHNDRHHSFSVNLERGAWVCFAGCGSGGLRGLAARLGLPVPRARPHKHGPLLVSEVEL